MHIKQVVTPILALAVGAKALAIPDAAAAEGSALANYPDVASFPEEFYQNLIYNDEVAAQGFIETWYANNSGKISLYQAAATEIRGFWGSSGLDPCIVSNLQTPEGIPVCLTIFVAQEISLATAAVIIGLLDIPDDDNATAGDIIKHNLKRGVTKYQKGKGYARQAVGAAAQEVETIGFRLNPSCAIGSATCDGQTGENDLQVVAIKDASGVHVNIHLDPSVDYETFEQTLLNTIPGVPSDLINEDGSVAQSNDNDQHEINYVSYNFNPSVVNKLSAVTKLAGGDYSPFDSVVSSLLKTNKKSLKDRVVNRAKALFGSGDDKKQFSSCYAAAADAGSAQNPLPFGAIGQTYYNSYGPADSINCYNVEEIKKSLI